VIVYSHIYIHLRALIIKVQLLCALIYRLDWVLARWPIAGLWFDEFIFIGFILFLMKMTLLVCNGNPTLYLILEWFCFRFITKADAYDGLLTASPTNASSTPHQSNWLHSRSISSSPFHAKLKTFLFNRSFPPYSMYALPPMSVLWCLDPAMFFISYPFSLLSFTVTSFIASVWE